jgi:hypothetical protein
MSDSQVTRPVINSSQSDDHSIQSPPYSTYRPEHTPLPTAGGHHGLGLLQAMCWNGSGPVAAAPSSPSPTFLATVLDTSHNTCPQHATASAFIIHIGSVTLPSFICAESGLTRSADTREQQHAQLTHAGVRHVERTRQGVAGCVRAVQLCDATVMHTTAAPLTRPLASLSSSSAFSITTTGINPTTAIRGWGGIRAVSSRLHVTSRQAVTAECQQPTASKEVP